MLEQFPPGKKCTIRVFHTMFVEKIKIMEKSKMSHQAPAFYVKNHRFKVFNIPNICSKTGQGKTGSTKYVV